MGSSGVARARLQSNHSRTSSKGGIEGDHDFAQIERGLAPVNEDMRGSQLNLKQSSLLGSNMLGGNKNANLGGAREPFLKDIDATAVDESSGEDDEEEEEMPEEFADLPPEEQQQRIKMRSAYNLLIGSVLVLLFSDPMVAALSALGDRSVDSLISMSYIDAFSKGFGQGHVI